MRLVAATNRDLRAALEDGSFREDLYYRLNVVPIDIPPLRDRPEDIPPLVDFFLERFVQQASTTKRSISPAAMKLLLDYHWPGNVRELQNVLERAVTLSSAPTLEVSDFHLMPSAAGTSAEPVLPPGKSLEDWENEIIREAMRRSGGNKSVAARSLGLSRNAFRYRLSKIGVPDTENE